MQTNYDVIIVGGGPAGYTAALYCCRAGLTALVLEELMPGGQMATTSEVDNYPGFPEGVGGFELAQKMHAGAERFGAKTVFTKAVALELEGEEKAVTAGGTRYTARTVILACGASPRELGLPEERALRGRGVSYCATCDGMIYRGKTVVVVGGGNTAAADALYLSRICEKVYLIHRRDTLRASRAYARPLEEAKNLEFVWNARITEVKKEKSVSGVLVEDVKTGQTRELSCSGVFVAVGNVPNTALLTGLVELDEHGYVKADETTRTNLAGVFAAGDVRAKALRQIVTAVSDGAVAAQGVEEYLALPGARPEMG